MKVDLLTTPHPDPDDGALWDHLPVEQVPVDRVVVSQTALDLRGLLDEPVAEPVPCRGLRLPDGRVRLVNGHHRFARTVLRGGQRLAVRVR